MTQPILVRVELEVHICIHYDPKEFVEKSKEKSKKDKMIALPESLMVGKCGGLEAFERAKKAGDIVEIEDPETGETFWSYKQLEVEKKEKQSLFTKAHGAHSIDEGTFRNVQAWPSYSPFLWGGGQPW